MGQRREPTAEELEMLRWLPDAEISRRTGVARDTIRRWRREYGIPRPGMPTQGGFAALPPPPPHAWAPGRQERERESAVLVMSDLHYGKRTATYNREVAKERLRKLLPRLERIHQLVSAAYEIDELVVAVLGDVNDGTEIYPAQPHYQDLSDPLQQAWEFAEFLAEWFREVQRIWGKVRIEAVAGNHGRTGKRAHEAANWDLACYHYLKLHLNGSGIPIAYGSYENGQDPFLRFMEVRRHRFLLYHGHAIRMYQTIAWYGLTMRMLRWQAALGAFSALLCGHFHSFGEMEINGRRVLLTGTLVTDDQWVLQTLGLNASNRWHLFGVGDKRPITWRFDLDLV